MALLESIMRAERPEKTDAAFSVMMIHYSKLIPSVNNEYSVENIEELANAILLAGGIKQNLLARKKAPDEYELIAGHRRHQAVKYLVEVMGCDSFAMVPVHVEKTGDVMSELQLILTNSSARERSDYEKMVEVSKLTHLMRLLQNGSPEDKELFHQVFGRESNISGREFRKVVAEKLGLSETKVANLNNIERNLIPELKDKFQEGSLGVSAANAAASLPAEEQKELTKKEEIRFSDVKRKSVSESDTENIGEKLDVTCEEKPNVQEPIMSCEIEANNEESEDVSSECIYDYSIDECPVGSYVMCREVCCEDCLEECDRRCPRAKVPYCMQEPEPEEYDKKLLEGMIGDAKEQLEVMGEYWSKSQPKTWTKHFMQLRAYERFLKEHEEDPSAKEISNQPELPVMKNNDQRKAFINSYQTWPVWFEVPCASEIYYRYDFEEGYSFVVCEYRFYAEWKAKYSDEDPNCAASRLYLLKPGYHYLHDCLSNETVMVEYLRKRKGN